MVHYWQIRLAFYRESIKKLRETLRQLGAAIVVLFQVAFPAVVFFFLIGLGQLAEPGLSATSYLGWLGGYGLLVYGVIRFQRSAILALPIMFWDRGLPVSKHQRTIVLIGLCLLAANVLLLLPFGLLIYLISAHLPQSFSVEGFEQLWPLLLSCFWGVYTTLLALFRHRFPLLILVILPALIWIMISYSHSDQLFWLTALLLAPLLNRIGVKDTANDGLRLRFIWQLLILYQMKNWQSTALKLIVLVLCCLFFSQMLGQVSVATQPWVILCCVFITSGIASTLKFSLLDFERQYQYFLSSLPIPKWAYRKQFLLFTCLFGMLFMLTTVVVIGFSVYTVLLWLTAYATGVWSVNRYRQRFFIPLIALFVLFAALLAKFQHVLA